MSVKMTIFYPGLQRAVNGRDSVVVHGGTVAECLRSLINQFPAAEEWLFDGQGGLLENVYVHVNAESAAGTGLSRSVTDGDELIIAIQLVGG